MTAPAHALLLDIPERLETAHLTLAATRPGMGAHADEEWVSMSSVEAVTETLIAVAREFCA